MNVNLFLKPPPFPLPLPLRIQLYAKREAIRRAAIFIPSPSLIIGNVREHVTPMYDASSKGNTYRTCTSLNVKQSAHFRPDIRWERGREGEGEEREDIKREDIILYLTSRTTRR